MISTNIRHFLDDNDEIPEELTPEARELLFFLSLIVETATVNYDKPISLIESQSHSLPDSEACRGDIEVWVFPENNQIGWECMECGEEGVISNWEGTFWDRRNYVRH